MVPPIANESHCLYRGEVPHTHDGLLGSHVTSWASVPPSAESVLAVSVSPKLTHLYSGAKGILKCSLNKQTLTICSVTGFALSFEDMKMDEAGAPDHGIRGYADF